MKTNLLKILQTECSTVEIAKLICYKLIEISTNKERDWYSINIIHPKMQNCWQTCYLVYPGGLKSHFTYYLPDGTCVSITEDSCKYNLPLVLDNMPNYAIYQIMEENNILLPIPSFETGTEISSRSNYFKFNEFFSFIKDKTNIEKALLSIDYKMDFDESHDKYVFSVLPDNVFFTNLEYGSLTNEPILETNDKTLKINADMLVLKKAYETFFNSRQHEVLKLAMYMAPNGVGNYSKATKDFVYIPSELLDAFKCKVWQNK